MLNSNLKRTFVVVSLLFLHPVLDSGSYAMAKRRTPPKAYSFIAEGGKASQGECDGERKIPRGLKKHKEFAKYGAYMGSELQTPEIKGKADEEMWKHLFRAKETCNQALAKTPSSIVVPEENQKQELPPDDSDESESSENESEQGEAESTDGE